MSDRIQRVLDGDLGPERLEPDELLELDTYQQAIGGVLAELRAVRAPDLSDAVMHRIDATAAGHAASDRGAESTARAASGRGTARSAGGGAAHGRTLGVLGWAREVWELVWSPRPVMVRPAWAMAAAALALAVSLVAGRATAPVGVPAAGDAGAAAFAAGQAQPSVFVHFRIDAPGAGEVRLAGDFSGWQPVHELHESAPGVWSVVVPVEPGVHHYAFVIDGERWVADPHAPQVDDGFGGANSRLAVLLPDRWEAS